tara:strand:+ start:11285 stop:11494 length:210 start_codon:yes stop_codon:yes gene_type:complete
MSKSKQLFTAQRQSEQEEYEEILYTQWIHHLEAQENYNSTQAIDILNEVFESVGKVYGLKNNQDEKRNI